MATHIFLLWSCLCGLPVPLVEFDEAAAEGLSPEAVRLRWPRLEHHCTCGRWLALYANYAHYSASIDQEQSPGRSWPESTCRR